MSLGGRAVSAWLQQMYLEHLITDVISLSSRTCLDAASVCHPRTTDKPGQRSIFRREGLLSFQGYLNGKVVLRRRTKLAQLAISSESWPAPVLSPGVISPVVNKTTLNVLLDHLVGACEQRRRKFEAKRFRGLEIDYKIVFCWRLNRQIGRFLALENAICITCCEPELVG